MPTTRSWIVPFVAIPLLVFVALAATVTTVPLTQDPADAPAPDPVAAEDARWRFAELVYRPVGSSDLHNVESRLIAKLWLGVRPDGGTVLEILYDNNDYKLVHVAEVLLRSRTPDHAPRDVPVSRRPISGMAFPSLR